MSLVYDCIALVTSPKWPPHTLFFFFFFSFLIQPGHWVISLGTLRASLSGTFLQILPDLVTPLKGHSISISEQLSIQRRGQRPPKGSDTNNYDCRSNLAPKHARKHETHPPRVKKERKKVPCRFKRFWFYFSWRKQHGKIKQTSVIIWVVCKKLTTV